jgi:hypothetical protein
MDEFVEEHESHLDVTEAEEHWDNSHVDSVSGVWQVTDLQPVVVEGVSGE